MVHVAWIKINIHSKSFSQNVKNKFEKVVGRAVLVTLNSSDRGAVVRLWPKFSFLALLFRLQNSSKLNYFVKIILMYKTCKFHEL